MKSKVLPVSPVSKIPKETATLIDEFCGQIETLESKNGIALPLFQDGKSKAYFIDCHILSGDAVDLLDYEASLDPEEQEDIRANRSLQSLHKLFANMQDDAKKGRQFNDIIVEYYPSGSRSDKPLKIFGGQHRAQSIELSAKSGVHRYHGFRVYFGLDVDQRNEIAQVSNSNINVPIDLFDKMQETVIGPYLRNWCKSVGLLTKDFAERKNNEGIITARLARTFVVNFIVGKENKSAYEGKPHSTLIGNEVNIKYLLWSPEERSKYLGDTDLLEAGKQFARLHKAQMDEVRKDSELSKVAEFKTKAITPTVISAWALVAGLLQKNKERLTKLYQLPDKTKGNPLAVKEMSEYRHQSDFKKPYRGLGTRTDKKERGKLVELFLLYAEKQQPKITTALIDSAVTNYFAYALEVERRKKDAKIK
jgi:hypothetical protein